MGIRIILGLEGYMTPVLRFEKNEITRFARRYQYPINEADLMAMKTGVNQRGHLTKDELAAIAYWKAPRSSGHTQKNSEDYVSEMTGFAFKTNSERARIESLTILDGVSWPTASVILHLFHRDPYPILDYRALWSVSLEVPIKYTFGFWWSYVKFCRSLAASAGVDMRTLDRAMWQYSKENQRITQPRARSDPALRGPGGSEMSLREEIIDAVIDGHIGQNGVVTRQEVIRYSRNFPKSYTGVILSNSEMYRDHSPTYETFTQRIGTGRYRIHPEIISQRKAERGL